MNGLSRTQLEAQHREWLMAYEAGKQQIGRLTEEIELLQQRLLTLNGAIQACTFLTQKIESTPINGEIVDDTEIAPI